MLIVCPSCASQYTIDPERVGADGRTVRCAKCRSTWLVAPPDRRVPELVPASPRAPERAGDAAIRAATPPVLSVEATSARTRPDAAADPAAKPAAGRRRRQPREANGRPRARFRVGFALAALAAALAVAAVIGRASVVETFPTTAKLYTAAGLPVNLRGLALRDVRSELSTADGAALLAVEGEIANLSAAAVDVPRLEIAVQGEDGQALYTWTNDPPRRRLERAETARFRARLASPPAEGRQVLVRFAPGSAGEAADAGGRP